MTHVLANLDGIATMLALLHLQGATCDRCGFGTRVTSTRWARCKRCGARVARRTIEDASAELSRRTSTQPEDLDLPTTVGEPEPLL